jgi:hypothetical protein
VESVAASHCVVFLCLCSGYGCSPQLFVPDMVPGSKIKLKEGLVSERVEYAGRTLKLSDSSLERISITFSQEWKGLSHFCKFEEGGPAYRKAYSYRLSEAASAGGSSTSTPWTSAIEFIWVKSDKYHPMITQDEMPQSWRALESISNRHVWSAI